MNFKRFSTALLTAGLVLLAWSPQNGVRADDIDIYVDPTLNAAEAPMVMFSVEYAPNTGATVCQAGACPANIVALYTDGHMVENPATTTIEHFSMLRGVLKKFIKTLKGVKIGLMFPHDNTCTGSVKSGPTANKCSNGGYFLHGFKLMQEGDANGAKAAILASLDAMPVPQGGLSHKYQGQEMFFEFYRYLSGRAWYNGHNGWNDYKTTNALNLDSAADSAYNAGLKLKWDTTIENSANYISPITADSKCAKIYTVNILGDQIASGVDSQSDTAIKATIANGGIPGIPQVQNISFNQVLKALYDNDVSPVEGKQTVTSYFIVNQGKINTTTRTYAGGGQGKASAEPYALTSNPDDLIDTLEQVFKNILSVSTTFVAPTVAVNVYNRAQTQNEVFIAMFQAPETGAPLWPGNLKKFGLKKNINGETEIIDRLGDFAVDTTKGRIKASALSYWTYQENLPEPAADELDFVDTKDGRGVARGGAGAKIPGFWLKCASATDPSCYPGDESPGLTNESGSTNNTSDRKVFYDKVVGTTTSLAALNADVATATDLHAPTLMGGNVIGDCTAADAVANPNSSCNRILYARGAEYIDHDTDELISATPTPRILRGRNNDRWLLGDLLHSRPLAVNYGARAGSDYSASNPDVRIITGSNDGLMHMFRNTSENQTNSKVPTIQDGVEVWAFMPRAVMPSVKVLNSGVGPPVHPYTVDGSPVVLIQEDGDGNIESGEKVWLFFGLRRGGKSIYALDISDPDDPKFMWSITGGTGDFTELGQTWSTPQTGYMLFDGSQTARPVLLFGGGYDTNKDTHPGHTDSDGNPITELKIGTPDSKGNAFFIVNAETGELVWKAIKGNGASTYKVFQHPDLTDSIPSEVTAANTNGNVLIDRVYFGDTGGKLWRADLYCHNQDGTNCPSFCENEDGTSCATAGWYVTPILSVGRYFNNALVDDRRFFYAPDFARSKDTTGNFEAIILGSGDREAPKDKTVKNWFYMFKDRYTVTGSIPQAFTPVLHNDNQLGDVSNDCLQTNSCGTAPNLTKGWKMRLRCQQGDEDNSCGEKALAPAITISGKIFFTTYLPPGGGGAICTLPEGNGLFYEISLQQGFAEENFFAGNGTTLSWQDRATLLASGGIPAEGVPLGGNEILRPDLVAQKTKARTGFKTFWYEKYLR